MTGWIDKVKDFIMGHPDAPAIERFEPAGPRAQNGDSESPGAEPAGPEQEPTGTPDVSDLPTDPGDAGAIPRDPEPQPGDEVVADASAASGLG